MSSFQPTKAAALAGGDREEANRERMKTIPVYLFQMRKTTATAKATLSEQLNNGEDNFVKQKKDGYENIQEIYN